MNSGLTGDTAAILESKGSFLEAGKAYFKMGRFDKALECYLKTEADGPYFILARKVYPRIKDQCWILDFADKLFEEKRYKQAKVLYEKLGLSYKLGFVAVMADEEEEALDYWNELEDSQEFNEICAFCLRYNKLKLGARLVFHVDPCFPFWIKGMINKLSTPAIFDLMEAYLDKHPDPAETLRWASRLEKRDRFGVNTFVSFAYYEKGQYFDRALSLLLQRSEMDEMKEITTRFKTDLESENLDAVGSAIRHFFLKQKTQYLSAVTQIDLTASNAVVFLLDWEFKDLVPTYVAAFDLRINALPEPIDHSLLTALAEKAKLSKLPFIAATCFLLMGELDQARHWYLTHGNPDLTAQFYLLMKKL